MLEIVDVNQTVKINGQEYEIDLSCEALERAMALGTPDTPGKQREYVKIFIPTLPDGMTFPTVIKLLTHVTSLFKAEMDEVRLPFAPPAGGPSSPATSPGLPPVLEVPPPSATVRDLHEQRRGDSRGC
jgi:hypothetical protein